MGRFNGFGLTINMHAIEYDVYKTTRWGLEWRTQWDFFRRE